MDDDEYSPNLADFFYHIAGDKTGYSASLESLFVCYTLARGLQLESTKPRRPGLPLELILRITRYAGFIDANPDPTLTLDVNKPFVTPHTTSKLYGSSDLSRTHILSMARIHLVPSPTERPEYLDSRTRDALFKPINYCRILPNKTRSAMILAPFIPCTSETALYFLQSTPNEVIVPNYFTPENTQDYFNQERIPLVYVVSGLPARVLFWRWWEPKF